MTVSSNNDKSKQARERDDLIDELKQLEALIEDDLDTLNSSHTKQSTLQRYPSTSSAESDSLNLSLNFESDDGGQTNNEEETVAFGESDFWDDVPILDDLVEPPPVLEPGQSKTAPAAELNVAAIAESVVTSPRFKLSEFIDDDSKRAREYIIPTTDAKQQLADIAEHTIDRLDQRLQEKTGRALSTELADELWQLLLDELESKLCLSDSPDSAD